MEFDFVPFFRNLFDYSEITYNSNLVKEKLLSSIKSRLTLIILYFYRNSLV
jgi:hypothetical protein